MSGLAGKLLLCLLLAAGVTWLLLEPEQKQWVVEQLHGTETVPAEPPTVATGAGRDSARPADTPATAAPGAHAPEQHSQRYATPADVDCRPAEAAPTREREGGIYSWSDESGRTHFGDARHRTESARDLTQEYATGLDFFSFSLEAHSGSLPPFFRDRLTADIEAIFLFLSGELELEQLRRVELNMILFEDQAAFGRLRRERAPGLSAAVGFYSLDGNIAAVLEQPDPSHTYRIARHEATHIINVGLFGISPLWLEEGLAEYFSDYGSEALHREFRPAPWRVEHLKQLERAGALPGLEAFLSLSREEWLSLDARTAYGLSWSVVAWLMNHEAGRQWLRTFLGHLADEPCVPASGVEQLARHYPGGVRELEQGWREWIDSH